MKKLITKSIFKAMEKFPNFTGKIIYGLTKIDLGPEMYISHKNLIKFKDIHKGERCFILANGPSIKNQDLTKLQDETVFTVNLMANKEDYPKIKSNYHIISGPEFFEFDVENEKNMYLYNSLCKLKTDDNAPVCFFPTTSFKTIKKTALDKQLDINYYFMKNDVLEEFKSKDFDFTKQIPIFLTVAQFAVALAIYMGFKDIYILGSDLTTISTIISKRLTNSAQDLHCYNIDSSEQNRVDKRAEQYSMEHEVYTYYRMFRDYRLINDYCKNIGVNLFNATDGGLLDNLTRVKYEELFDTEK